VKALAEPPDLIVTSDLLRTRETAAIVRAALGPVDLRRAGRACASAGWASGTCSPSPPPKAGWPAATHRPAASPPMTSAAHRSGAGRAAIPLLQRRVLLVGSKGVGRVLRGCAGLAAPASRWTTPS
jgi:broad specificity phosphatase PhoE